MSIRVMSAVWDLSLPDSEKIVLLALADCANDDGVCWPGMNALTRKCSKSDRTIQAAIKSLEAAGHLTRVEKLGKGCTYTIHPRKDFGATPEAASPPKPLRPRSEQQGAPEAASGKPSGTLISGKGKPSQKKRAVKPPAFALPSDIPADPWADFEAMRRRIGKPMTDKARELAIGRLRKLAEDGWPPGDVLNHSILNNYQGLFPPKDDLNAAVRTHRGPAPRSGDGFIRALHEAAGLGAADH